MKRPNYAALNGWSPIWLTSVLLLVRLAGVDIPWLWVFSPMWLPPLLALAIVVLVVFVLFVAAPPVRAIVRHYRMRKVQRVIKQFQRWDGKHRQARL